MVLFLKNFIIGVWLTDWSNVCGIWEALFIKYEKWGSGLYFVNQKSFIEFIYVVLYMTFHLALTTENSSMKKGIKKIGDVSWIISSLLLGLGNDQNMCIDYWVVLGRLHIGGL